jgi:hypothetical protein
MTQQQGFFFRLMTDSKTVTEERAQTEALETDYHLITSCNQSQAVNALARYYTGEFGSTTPCRIKHRHSSSSGQPSKYYPMGICH